MHAPNVRLVDLLGQAPGSYELKVISFASTTVTSIPSGAGYTPVPLSLEEGAFEEDVQIVVRSRIHPTTVIAQGVLRLRWDERDKAMSAHKTDDFPPNLDVVADTRTSLTIQVQHES